MDVEYETLSDEYALTNKAFSLIDQAISDESSLGFRSELNTSLDMQTLKAMFHNEDWVYILCDRIASKIAAQELRVVKEIVRDGESIYEPVESHPVQDRIYFPNQHQTYFQFMYSYIADLCLSGNAIAWNANNIEQLIHIPIEMIQPELTIDSGLRKYRIVQVGNEIGFDARHIMSLDPENVAHARRPNPSSALWGLSPFIPGRRAVQFNKFSNEYLNNYYNKGAQPGLIFEMSDVANEKAALRLLRSVEASYVGRKNQRRNMALPKGVKATTVSHTLADQQLKDYINQNRETIINILQVPKHELSIAESGSLGSEEYKTAIKNFWNGPLKSMMKNVEEIFTKLFKDQLGEGFYLEFDLSNVDVLQDDLNSRADLAIKMLQTHTLNEVRSKVFKDPPTEGGDLPPMIARPQVPQQPFFGFAAPGPTQQLDAPAVMVAEELAPVKKDKTKFIKALKATNQGWWEKREEMLQADAEKTFPAIHELVLDLFSNQIADIITVIRNEFKAQGIKANEEKEPNKAKLRRAIDKSLAKSEEDWIKRYDELLFPRVELGVDAQVISPFGLKDSQAFQVARDRSRDLRRETLNDHGYDAFANINATTSRKVLGIVTDAFKDGKTTGETATEIRKKIEGQLRKQFTSEEYINFRAQTIARTEMLTATSLGQAAAMELTAEQTPDLVKIWLTAKDDRVRGNPGGLYPNAEADHHSLDGDEKNWDEDFVDSKGIKYGFPRDPKAGPAGVINCRCAMTQVSRRDLDALNIDNISAEPEDAPI